MASQSLQELLGYKTLTGLIQATVPGVPDVLPAVFDSFTKEVLMDDGEYTVRYGNRGVARKAKFGAPARKRGLRDIGVQPVRLMHFIEEQEYDAKTMMKLRSASSYERDSAYEEFTSQVAYFNEYITNLEKVIKFKTLKSPTLYFGENGDLLPSSSGAVETITLYSQNANNINQLNGIIAATWATAATDIPSHLRNLKKNSISNTGYEVKYAFYGAGVPSYMTANNYVKDYLARNPGRNADFLATGEIGDLFDYTWVPGYKAFWKSTTTTDQDTTNYVLADDEIVFTPEPNRGWWEKLIGTYPVPTNINIVTDAEAAMNQIKLVPGKFSYAQVTTRPIGALLTTGHTFLFAQKVPDAVYVADVAF